LSNQLSSTKNRECEVTVPDGNYAMQTDSGSVSQCLVHWQEPGQIYPERYSWGGRSTTQTEGASELGSAAATRTYGTNWEASKNSAGEAEDVKPAPDYCENPICGVCDWNDEDPKDNLVKGMETVWTFRRLEDDLYLILNAADGQGFRCFGFQVPDAPYPTMISWKQTMVDAATGICGRTATETCVTDGDCQLVELTGTFASLAAGDIIEQSTTVTGSGNARDVTSTAAAEVVTFTTSLLTVKMIDGDMVTGFSSTGFSVRTSADAAATIAVTAAAVRSVTNGNDQCNKETEIVGEWVTDGKGPDGADGLDQCRTDRNGNPTQCKLSYFCGMEDNANGRAYGKLLANGGPVWNVQQLGCTADPRRRWLCEEDTAYDNKFMIRSLAGQDANDDGAITVMDYECLYFPQIAGGQYTHPRRAPKSPSADGVWGGLMADADGNGDNECGISALDGETQEEALVANKQATWTLIPLPDY
jgi:hypothetical protein